MKSTLDQFMMSPDEEITERHVPKRWLHRHLHVDHVSEDISRLVVADAKNIWTKMSDPEEASVKISHDGYLKVWQLGRPVLNDVKKIRHDVLLVDEGQDMNPAMLDVFHRQSSTPRFIVGDPHQQVYVFRGAVNALGQVAADRTYRQGIRHYFQKGINYIKNYFVSKVMNYISNYFSKNVMPLQVLITFSF